jgi:mitogen-activated protein kinase organizer 1
MYDISSVCIDSSNSKFVSCGGDKSIFLWDVMSGNILKRFTGHEARVNAVGINHDCSVVFSGSYDGKVRAWDTKGGNPNVPIQTLSNFKDSITSIIIPAFDSSSSNEIIAASVDGTVKTFDLRMGEVRSDVIDSPVTSLALTPDGKCVVANCLDENIYLIEKSTGELLKKYNKGHSGGNYALGVAATDTEIVSGSESGEVVVYSLLSGEVKEKLLYNSNASDTQGGRSRYEVPSPPTAVCGVAMSPVAKSSVVIGANWGGNVVVYADQSEADKW